MIVIKQTCNINELANQVLSERIKNIQAQEHFTIKGKIQTTLSVTANP